MERSGAAPSPTPDLSPADRLEQVGQWIERELRTRMELLYDEAQIVSCDMEALAIRLREEGHIAFVDDFRTERFHRMVAELRLLQSLYEFFCSVAGRAPNKVSLGPPCDECESICACEPADTSKNTS